MSICDKFSSFVSSLLGTNLIAAPSTPPQVPTTMSVPLDLFGDRPIADDEVPCPCGSGKTWLRPGVCCTGVAMTLEMWARPFLKEDDKRQAQGEPAGKFLDNIGDDFFFGKGDAEVDRQKAAYFYIAAAERGDVGGQSNAGYVFYNGEGCERSMEAAVHYYKLASDQGSANSQFCYGEMLFRGAGVEQPDEVTGRMLVSQAAAKGYANAVAWLAEKESKTATGLDKNKALKRATKATKEAIARDTAGRETWGPLFPNGQCDLDRLRETRACDVCGATPFDQGVKISFCAGCFLANYCSTACQMAARPGHKAECKREADAKKAAARSAGAGSSG